MAHESTPPPQRIARKLNRRIALSQLNRGYSQAEIARMNDVDQSTVCRFVAKIGPERQGVAVFKDHRADILARLQAKSLDIQEQLIESLGKDGVITSMKNHEKAGLLQALNAQCGTSFDKERLERGQSTSNQSVVTTLLNGAVKSLYAPPPHARTSRKHAPKQQPEIG